MNKLPVIYLLRCYTIGNFRVPPWPLYQNEVKCSAFDIWKWFFILVQVKHISTRKVVHLASFWKWGFFELRSGLLYWGIQCNVVTPSCSNKPSSNVLLTERKLLKFTGLRDGITCVRSLCRVWRLAVPHPWFSDLPLKINYKETLLQGKIEIIWLCININKKFLSLFIAETIMFCIKL